MRNVLAEIFCLRYQFPVHKELMANWPHHYFEAWWMATMTKRFGLKNCLSSDLPSEVHFFLIEVGMSVTASGLAGVLDTKYETYDCIIK
jgi:hypothetical protein